MDGEKRCARCGRVREDHSFNGACYGVCGQFVEPKPTSNERVTVGYEINEALTQYLDATDRRSKEEAEFRPMNKHLSVLHNPPPIAFDAPHIAASTMKGCRLPSFEQVNAWITMEKDFPELKGMDA